MDVNNKFIGWIPCLLGGLNFRLITAGLQGSFSRDDDDDKNVIVIRDKTDEGELRRFVIQSRVNWRDSDHHSTNLGSFRVFVTGKVDSLGGWITGNLMMYASDAEKVEYSNKIKKTVTKGVNANEYAHKLNDSYTNNNLFCEDLFEKLEGVVSRKKPLTNFDERFNAYYVKFLIYKDGLVELRFVGDAFGDSISQYEINLIARQAYYYLKYSLHCHKHHNYKGDALTTTIPMAGCKSVLARKLIGQLTDEMIEIKRSPVLNTGYLNTKAAHDCAYSALGICEYTKSLIKILSLRGFIDLASEESNLYFVERYSHSVNALIEKSKGNTVNHRQRAHWAIVITALTSSLLYLILQMCFKITNQYSIEQHTSDNIVVICSIFLIMVAVYKLSIWSYERDFNKTALKIKIWTFLGWTFVVCGISAIAAGTYYI